MCKVGHIPRYEVYEKTGTQEIAVVVHAWNKGKVPRGEREGYVVYTYYWPFKRYSWGLPLVSPNCNNSSRV
jgi:hypothetical protein